MKYEKYENGSKKESFQLGDMVIIALIYVGAIVISKQVGSDIDLSPLFELIKAIRF